MAVAIMYWTLFLLLGSMLKTTAQTSTTTKGIVNNVQVRYSFVFNENCAVNTVSPSVRSDLAAFLDDGAKLIQISLSFVNHSGPLPGKVESAVFNPFYWRRTTGRQGRGLLLLENAFKSLSLTTLSYSVNELDVELVENPPRCLLSRNVNEIEKFLRELLLNDFVMPSAQGGSNSLSENENICNMQVRDKEGTAEFFYVCCKLDKNVTVCEELEEDVWISALFLSIFILNFIVIMYCPLLIPHVLYKDKERDMKYEFCLKNPIVIRVMKKFISKRSEQGDNVLSLRQFDSLTAPKFRKKIDEMEEDVVYSLTISKLNILVKFARLVPPNEVPVGIPRALYDSVIRCKIREKESIHGCCVGNLFGKVRPFGKTYPWYVCLQQLMWCILLLIITMPWIIRLYLYYAEENEDNLARYQTASAKGLEVSYPGTFVEYLTPVHGVFLVAYGCLLFDGLLMGIISKDVTEKFKLVLRKCFRDMKEVSRSRAIGWSARVLLMPLKSCGIFVFPFIWIYWILLLPFIIIVVAFYFFPTVNVLGRLLVHFVAYCIPYGKALCSSCFNTKFLQSVREDLGFDILTEKESLERPDSISMRYRLFQILVINICMLSILSFVLLAFECIIFFLEMAVYTLIGVIINASDLLKFVTLTIMLFLYAKDCFGSVTSKYLVYSEKLIAALVKKGKEEVEKTAWLTEEMQANTVFALDTGHECEHETDEKHGEVSLVVSNGALKWKLRRAVLFMDRKDKISTTQKFFFETAYMPHEGCPGKLFANLFSAVSQFMVIVIFLLFVLLVVKAFGETYEISGANQLLATLAGGFLPWMLRFVLFKPPPDIVVDTDNMHFQNLLNRKIHGYEQNWRAIDIDVDKLDVYHSKKRGNGRTTGENEASSDTTDETADIIEKETDKTLKKQNSDTERGENYEMEPIVTPEEEAGSSTDGETIDLIINTAVDSIIKVV